MAVRADVHARLALGIGRAFEVLAETPFFLHDRLATYGALELGFDRTGNLLAVHRALVGAGGLLVAPPGAADELAAGPLAVHLHQRAAALRACFADLLALAGRHL